MIKYCKMILSGKPISIDQINFEKCIAYTNFIIFNYSIFTKMLYHLSFDFNDDNILFISYKNFW